MHFIIHPLFRDCGNVTSKAANLLTALIVNKRPNIDIQYITKS